MAIRCGMQARAAHPRSRGENNHVGGPADYELGSSPLTRGKPGRGPLCLPTRRLIPAHAGKTSWKPTRRRPSAAHPRSRGENPMRSRTLAAASGSSPLTRGKRLHQDPFVMTVRLIPAHAGKTQCSSARLSALPAHPRSRGENVHGCVDDDGAGGSSPLTRGKRTQGRCLMHDLRLIPAHAGKTLAIRYGVQANPAHPRSRGENRLSIGAGDRRAGSSPLTRGKRRTEC